MAFFGFDGHRLAYTVHGEGDRTTVLMPGLLLSQRMQTRLARDLASDGNRVVTFDPLGHGASDRPREMWRYSIPAFATQTVALLDHLGVEQAVVGGTSLGANISLEVASIAPERVRGMLLEMPALDNAIPACAVAFTPLLLALTFGAPAMSAVARGSRLVPRQALPGLAAIALDWLSQDPRASGSVLQGILFGRTAPDRMVRQGLQPPALVIGHPRDPVHPFSDADALARELPNARLLDANSAIELRVRPARLTAKIAEFIGDCWDDRGAQARPAKRRRATSA